MYQMGFKFKQMIFRAEKGCLGVLKQRPCNVCLLFTFATFLVVYAYLFINVGHVNLVLANSNSNLSSRYIFKSIVVRVSNSPYKASNSTATSSNAVKRSFVVSNHGEIYLLGAAGVNSSVDSVWDKFHVYGQWNKKRLNKNFLCCLRYPDGNVTQLPVTDNFRFFTTKVPMPVLNVMCANARHGQTDERGGPVVPSAISIVRSGDSCKRSKIKYIKPYFPLRQATNSLAITTKISHGSMSPDLLIAWMEAYIWLGADKVITYALSNVTTDFRKVLEYYAARNVLDLYDYQIPGLDQVPRSLSSRWGQTWTDAAVPMFDALALSSGYTYFSVVDWDEFIVPTNNRTLKQLMGDLFDRHSHAAGFSFTTQFYITSAQPEDSDIYLRRFVKRVHQPPELDRRKIIFKPSLARLGHTHSIKPLLKGFQTVECPSSDAFIRHFRYCMPDHARPMYNISDCVKGDELDLIRDSEVADWSDRIADKIRRAKTAIFPNRQ